MNVEDAVELSYKRNLGTIAVSWTIGARPNANLVNTMLDAAIEKVASSNERPVVHSDRGGHYQWPSWLARMHNSKLISSMSRKGC